MIHSQVLNVAPNCFSRLDFLKLLISLVHTSRTLHFQRAKPIILTILASLILRTMDSFASTMFGLLASVTVISLRIACVGYARHSDT